MKILSIDIGIVNLGYVFAEISFQEIEKSSKYKNLELNSYYLLNKETIKNNIHIIKCNRVDITKVKHLKIKKCECKLYHDNCIPDYLDHFIQENQDIFDLADKILIERQPPIGITNVQDLLFTKFRDRVELISPNSVHKYFKMSKNYDERKISSEKTSLDYLSEFMDFKNNMRKHDMSDAMLIIIYYYKISVDKLIKETDYTNDAISLEFEKFRYKHINI